MTTLSIMGQVKTADQNGVGPQDRTGLGPRTFQLTCSSKFNL